MIFAVEYNFLQWEIEKYDEAISRLTKERHKSSNGMERMALSDAIKHECVLRMEKFVSRAQISFWLY